MQVFIHEADSIEADYEPLKDDLALLIEKELPKAEELEGYWSVDFLWTGSEFVLIDMALAENSYYRETAYNKEK